MILQASKHKVIFPFKYVSYLLDKNKESLAKLCINLPLEESQLKHFTTLILNMSKLRHIHITSNSNIDRLPESMLLPLKHLLSKDSLTTIVIDCLPLQEDFGIIGFSTNLQQLILGIVITNPMKQTRKDYCSFVFQILSRVATLQNIEVVHIKPRPLSSKKVAFFE